jgi:hypothetical protein
MRLDAERLALSSIRPVDRAALESNLRLAKAQVRPTLSGRAVCWVIRVPP